MNGSSWWRRRERFEPSPALSWDQLRAERLHELRWWHIDEVEVGDDSTA
jgi:hypothetical protein